MNIDRTIRLNITRNGAEPAGAGNHPRISLAPGTSKRLGRSARADVVVNDPSVSRIHARLVMEPDGQIAVDDLGSTNGVLVNGIEQRNAYLMVGDIVSFGNVEYVVGEGCLEPKSAAPAEGAT